LAPEVSHRISPSTFPELVFRRIVAPALGAYRRGGYRSGLSRAIQRLCQQRGPARCFGMAQQTISTLPKDSKRNDDSAQNVVHPSGKFLYDSDRGHDSIAVFAIDATKGTLTPIAMFARQGKTPHNFEIDATGPYLLAASQESKNIVAFRSDQKTLRLASSGQVVEVGMPVCVGFVVVE